MSTVLERRGDHALLAWVEIPNTRAATLAAWAMRDGKGGWTIWSGLTRKPVGGASPERNGRPLIRTGAAGRATAQRKTEAQLYEMARVLPDALPLTHGPG